LANERLEIEKVNKYGAGWCPEALYTGFRIRAVLKDCADSIEQIQNTHLMRRKLRKEFGVEGEDWIIADNRAHGTVDLYLPNSGKLLLWKLQDAEAFSKLFDAVEQHVDDLNEIRERQSD
jgi:hypothetical protein